MYMYSAYVRLGAAAPSTASCDCWSRDRCKMARLGTEHNRYSGGRWGCGQGEKRPGPKQVILNCRQVMISCRTCGRTINWKSIKYVQMISGRGSKTVIISCRSSGPQPCLARYLVSVSSSHRIAIVLRSLRACITSILFTSSGNPAGRSSGEVTAASCLSVCIPPLRSTRACCVSSIASSTRRSAALPETDTGVSGFADCPTIPPSHSSALSGGSEGSERSSSGPVAPGSWGATESHCDGGCDESPSLPCPFDTPLSLETTGFCFLSCLRCTQNTNSSLSGSTTTMSWTIHTRTLRNHLLWTSGVHSRAVPNIKERLITWTSMASAAPGQTIHLGSARGDGVGMERKCYVSFRKVCRKQNWRCVFWSFRNDLTTKQQMGNKSGTARPKYQLMASGRGAKYNGDCAPP